MIATELEIYRRPGKLDLRPGDVARVSSSTLEVGALVIPDRGWSGAKILRLLELEDGRVLAEVSHPKRAATRTISAARLTRTRSSGIA